MEVSWNRGTQELLVFVRDNPMKMDDDWGYPYDLGNLHMFKK